jgi:RNA polymerase sigma-70 factor (ECF subfamily)
MPDIDEQALVARAQSDPQAFAALYDRYLERIYAYAYRQTNNEALAQDITSATFEKALRHIRRFEWQGVRFGAWLYGIARNEIAQHYRRRRFLVPWLGQRDTRGQAVERRPETAVQASQRQRQLQAALARLSAKDQEIVRLRFFEGLSSADVAQLLDCSRQTVYLRLHRALKRLRQQLDLMQITEEASIDLHAHHDE